MHAHLVLGREYLEYGEKDKALDEFLMACDASRARAEPYYHLANYYRSQKDYELCTYYAMKGKECPFPKEGALFLMSEVYGYLLDQELSIAAYYTPFKKEGYEAINRLLVNKRAPSHIKHYALNNAIFYAKPLPATLIPVGITPPMITDSESYYPMNPSIQRTGSGFEIICRTVNFGQNEAQKYWSRDPNNPKVSTRNFLICTDKELHTLSQEEIVDRSDYPRFPSIYKEGLEDCRLVSFKGENWFTCSLFDANPSNTIQIGLGKIGDDGTCRKIQPLVGPDRGRCEKNWLPFVYKEAIHVVYSHDPFTIYKPDPASGYCRKMIETVSPFDCSRCRGSAGPIPFDEGYLTLVHEVAYSGRRYYLHRFVYLDKNFRIEKVSPLFYIKKVGIEYCAGMTLDHEEKNLVITLGVEDKEAYLVITPVEEVKNSLVAAF